MLAFLGRCGLRNRQSIVQSGITGLVIAGLRYVGKANITPERVLHLRKLISPEDRRRLLEDITLAPAWMHPYFRAIAREDDIQ